ncbi:TPA: hypothetical protein QHR21_004886 [Klebsiella pneumoniae]|nr:hypothetical protein [Klebsiella pneumoniae]
MRKNGYYFSGHTAYSWTIALVLAQIEPEKAEAIIKRGYDYELFRVICGAECMNAGRVVGLVEYFRLQSIPKRYRNSSGK